jgi:phytoene dehydrogenase-like protein
MSNAADGIILGAGHNGLILAAYLARCGLRITVIEASDVPGGGLATEENPRAAGFWHNTHSFFHRGITEMPWYKDLQLLRHGARYLEPQLNVALVLRDGRSLQWWTDSEKTIESFAQFSRRDAETLRRWIDEFTPIVEKILIPEARNPPLPPEVRRRLLNEGSGPGRRLLEVAALSPLEFVQREFTHDVIRAGLLFFNGLREVDLRLKGFGHSIPALLASRPMAQVCVGGSAQLAQALVRGIRQHGGEVLTGVHPRAILVRQGRTTGVQLQGEQTIEARAFVASGLNPQQTLVELLDASVVPSSARQAAQAFRYNLLAPLFALNLALNEPPRYRAAEQDPHLDQALMVILGLERMDQFDAIVRAHEKKTIPPTVMWGACPTRFDPSQAPPGKHTAFMWEKLPFALDGSADNWDAAAAGHGEKMLALWRAYAPNLIDAALVDRFVRTPLDTQRKLPNMREGDLLVGAFAHGQVGYHRPFPGAGHYRSGVAGLYLCGGSCHPGGNITGLCGYNAASVIAADLGLNRWWNPPDLEASLRGA